MLVCAYIPSTQESEVGGSLQVEGQLGVQRKILSMSRKKEYLWIYFLEYPLGIVKFVFSLFGYTLYKMVCSHVLPWFQLLAFLKKKTL